MANVLKVSAIQLCAPVTVVVGVESYDLAFHNSPAEEPFSRIMISNILNLVAALTACG